MSGPDNGEDPAGRPRPGAPKRGQEFTHRRYLDERRRPARMRVTAVARGRVYFTYADSPTNKGDWHVGLDAWIDAYG